MENLAIYGWGEEGCHKVYSCYKALGEKSEFGRLIQQYLTEHLSRDSEFAIIGIPGTKVPGTDASAVYVPHQKEMLGKSWKTSILLPYDQIPIKNQLNFNHEAVHYFVHHITPDKSVNPFSSLPDGVTGEFIKTYLKQQEILMLSNPHAAGTTAWHRHNFMNKCIFVGPSHLAYANNMLEEITAWSLQCELTFPGSLRKHSPPIADALENVVRHHVENSSSSPFRPQTVSRPYFMKEFQSVSLAELNSAPPLSSIKSVLKSVGNGVKKALNNPATSIVFESIYYKDEENTLLKAVINGTISWELAIADFKLYSMFVGPYCAAVLTAGSIAAEFAPDFQKMAHDLPTKEEIDSMYGEDRLLSSIILEHTQQAKLGFIALDGLRKGLKKLPSLSRFFNYHGREKVERGIDAVLPDYQFRRERDLQQIELKLSELESFVAEEITPYLNNGLYQPGGRLNRTAYFEVQNPEVPENLLDRLSTDDLTTFDQIDKVLPQVKKFLFENEATAKKAKEIDERPADNKAILKHALDTATVIASEVCELLAERDQNKINCSRYKGFFEDYINHRESQKNASEVRELQFSYHEFADVREHIFSRISPRGLFETLQETQKFSSEYEDEVNKVRESVATNHAIRQGIEQTQNLNDRLAQSNKEDWKKALKAQKKLAEKIGLAKTILAVTGAIAGTIAACTIPGGQVSGLAIASASLNLLNQGGQAAQQVVNRKTEKINNSFQRKQDEITKRSDSLHQSNMLAQEQGFDLKQRQFQQQNVLIYCGSAFDINTYCKLLDDSITLQKQSLSETIAGLEAAEKTIKDETDQAAADQKKLDRVLDIKRNRAVRDNLTQSIADHKAKAAEASVSVLSLKKQEDAQKKQLKETEEKQKETDIVRPFKQFIQQKYVDAGLMKFAEGKQIPVLTPEQQEGKIRRDAFIETFQESINLVETQHQFNNEIIGVAQEYAHLIGGYTGSALPAELVSIGRNLLEIAKQREIYEALEKLKVVMDKETGARDQTNAQLSEKSPGEAMSPLTQLTLMTVKDFIPVIRLMGSIAKLSYNAYIIWTGEPPKDDPSPYKSEMEVYLSSLDESVKFLYQFISKEFEGLSDQHQELREFISSAEKEILDEIKTGSQKVASRVNVEGYNKYLQRRFEQIDKIQRKCSYVKVDEIEPFLTYVETLLTQCSAPHNCGIISGNSLTHNQQVPYEAVDLKLAYRNPEHLTGLLFTHFGWNHEVPNLALLNSLTGGFATAFEALLRNNLENDPHLNDKVQRIVGGMVESFIKFEKACGMVGDAIAQVCARQQKILQGIVDRRKKIQIFNETIVAQNQAEALKNSEKQRERLLGADFVGYSKFFLYDELVNAPLSSRMAKWDLDKIMDEVKFGKGTLGKVAKLGAYTIGLLMAVPFCGGLTVVAPPVGVAYGVLYSGKVVYDIGNGAVNGIHKVESISSSSDQRVLETKTEVSLKSLIKNPPSLDFMKKSLKYIYEGEKLALNLTSRKITTISSPKREEEHPLVNLELDIYDFEEGMYPENPRAVFNENSLAGSDDIEKIPNPRTMYRDEEYNSKVRELIGRYFTFIGGVMDEANLEAFLGIDSSRILTSQKSDLVPLAFPKNLLETFEQKIMYELQMMEGVGAGTLIPFYNLATDNQRHVLSIVYRFVPTDGTKPLEFCHFDVAYFDNTTIKAFEKDLISNEQTHPNEFLIQAMYGGYYGLGLPGKGTYTCSRSGLIAPSEAAFQGLYKIWKDAPEAVVKYNSSEYTGNTHDTMGSNPPARHIFDKDYLVVMKQLRLKKDKLSQEVEEYEKDYFALFALFKMMSGVSNEILFKEMKSKLALHQPHEQDRLYQTNKEIHPIPMANIESFVKMLESIPNANRTTISRNLNKF